jgi:hypothetical protein
MKFATVITAMLSMAVFAAAAPIASEGTSPLSHHNGLAPRSIGRWILMRETEVAARQNHGMCVKSTAGTVEQIPNC